MSRQHGSDQTILAAEVDGEDRTCYLIQPQSTDTGTTSPSTDPTTPGLWKGSYWASTTTGLAGRDPWTLAVQVDTMEMNDLIECNATIVIPHLKYIGQ